jgi:hypothetical protein
MTKLTCEEAHEVFRLDPETGHIYWRRCGRKRTLGKPVGHAGKYNGYSGQGYRRVWYDGHKYLVHRIIWLMVTGVWPLGQIDHIDGNKRNNKPSNLRDVTPAQNTSAYWSNNSANFG